jgi:type I restriction enzyme S subunit
MDTKALRQKILDLAIRGKLVPQDPNDEPASVLLERIREQKKQMVKDGKLKAKDVKNDTVIFVGEDNLHYEKFADGSVKCIEDEIPFDVPEGWAWSNLGIISDVYGRIGFRGYTKNDLVEKGKGAITLSPSNIVDNKMNYDSCSYISWKKYEESPEIMIYNDDILLVKTGSSYGKVAFVENLPEKATINPQFVVLKSTRINAKYLCYFLQSSYAKDTFEKFVVGTAIPTFSQTNLNAMYIAIPGLEEQEKIVRTVSEYLSFINTIDDDKKELFSIIQKAKSKILDLAIRGKLVPQNPNDEPASVLLERIRAEKEELIKQGKIKRDKKESIIFRGEDNSYYEKIGNTVENIDGSIPFEIPENWCFVRLKELWELISGRDLSPSEYNDNQDGVPYITGASNLKNGKIELVRWTPAPQVITKQGDLLLTCKGTVGEMAFNDFGNAHIARQIMAIRNTYGLNVEYLSFCISFYIEEIKAVAKGLIPGISREDILNLILPIPPENYQRLVVSQIRKSNYALYLIEKSLS